MKKISYTAAYIVVKFFGLTKDPKIASHFSLFVLDFYQKMVRFLPNHLSWYQNSLNLPFWRKFFIWSEELLLPGDLMHIICRKYYMTRFVEDALASGVEQVVSMGAGFDHLAALSVSKGIPSFELDMNWMIENKRAFLDENGYTNELLSSIPADFMKQRLAEVLKAQNSFDPKKKSLFIGEGFFDYLPLETTKEILQDIKSLNPHNQLLTTFFSLDELNWFHRFSFTSGVSLVGESLKLPLNRVAFIDLLNEFGFTIEKEISHQQMKSGLVTNMGIKLPVLKGFYVLLSTINEV